jgi:tetratricopeptide (TPR) repeat protein
MLTLHNDFSLPVTFHFPEGKRYAFAFITLFVFLFLIYGNSFHGEFHFDDYSNIVHNSNVHLKDLSWKSITKTFYFEGKLYRPFACLSLGLNYYVGGLDVFGYHVVNFAVHYLSAVFLFLLIFNTLRLPLLRDAYRSSSYTIALLAAFFWATNPVQVHAVTIIVQRMASMAGLFYVMAMYLYLKGRTADRRGKRITFFILCGLTSLLSFGTKQNTAFLPVSIFLYDLFLIQGMTRQHLMRSLKIIILPLAVILVMGLIYTRASSLLEGYAIRPFTATERMLTEPRVILFYISLLFYPVSSRLMLLHDVDISTSLFTPWTTLPAILLILLLVACAFFLSRKRPILAFSILFFFVNHVIEGSIIPLELIFEHRNYIPSMFLFVPVAIAVVRVLDHFAYSKAMQCLLAAALVIALAGQGYTTYTRNGIVRSQYTLWLDNAEKAPGLSTAHNNLGKQYFERGWYEDAAREYEKAISLNRYVNRGQSGLAYHNLGWCYLIKTGDFDGAYPYFKKALEGSREYMDPWLSMAFVEMKRGNLSSARQYITEAMGYWPENEVLKSNLNVVLLAENRVDEAIAAGLKASVLQPGNINTLIILGEAYRRKGNWNQSIYYWQKYVQKMPYNLKGYIALVELYAREEGNRAQLTKTIGTIMYLRGERDFRDLTSDRGGITDSFAYVPDPETIVPIIEKILLEEGKSISPKAKERGTP